MFTEFSFDYCLQAIKFALFKALLLVFMMSMTPSHNRDNARGLSFLKFLYSYTIGSWITCRDNLEDNGKDNKLLILRNTSELSDKMKKLITKNH